VENLNLPNLFTSLRLFSAPGVIWLILEDRWAFACWLFVAAALTDGVDGWLARRLNQATALGAALDTVTDKALGLGVLIVLSALGLVPAWATLAIVVRDVVVVLGAIAYKGVAGRLEIQPTVLGKANTVAEFAMLSLVLGQEAGIVPGDRWLMPMFDLVFATTVASGIQYVWVWSGKARRSVGGL
jgi:cardiolipin synthase (CMP-forming)